MVYEDIIQSSFAEWLGAGLPTFGMILLAAIVLGVFFGYLVASFRHGPFEAFYVVAQVIAQAIPDFLFISPRRVTAIARLAVKEAFRRKVILVTFGIFATTLLFGGWFMNSGSLHPDRIYVNFVLWGTQLLVLLMGMLISSFSLPEDIKNKTIYTVVTKPVRSTEIVMGRIAGFGLVGTVLLGSMGIISFFFVWRGLAHEHQIVGATQTLASFTEIAPDNRSAISGRRVSDNAIMEAQTNVVSGHSHRLELIEDIRLPTDPEPRVKSNIIDTKTLPDGRIVYRRVDCLPVGGHSHKVTIEGQGDSAIITLGPAIGYFRARVPIAAYKLQFYDRLGKKVDKGTNIGKEWTYRGYIDGGNASNRSSLSKAVFDFEGFTADKFRDADILPLEMTLGVFRTYKADIEKRVSGGIQFESIPEPGDNILISDVIVFETNEYTIQTRPISRKILGKKMSPEGNLIEHGEYDLFDDFAQGNQKIRLILTCRDISQYLGVAQQDVYFRSGDQIYWQNFAKGYLGIWCQMIIIIAMGVALSTFLSAPVTMLGTIVMIILGFFTTFVRDMTEVNHEGGGPIESFIRVVTQQNMVLELDTGIAKTFIKQADNGIVQVLNSITYLAPNFSTLNFSEQLTMGYAINFQLVLIALTTTLAFCVGLTILGYFALKTREIAK